MSTTAKAVALLVVPLAIAGCRTNPTAGFSDVQKTVAERSGHEILWPMTGEANEQANTKVRGLLAQELTAESAVQIALLNNRHLRSTFEELGISRADVIQAALPRNPEFTASIRFPDRPPSGAKTDFGLAADFLDLLLLPLKKRLANAQLEQTKLRVSHEILQTIAEVKTALYTVQARQQLARRLQAIVEINDAGVDLSLRQHQAGNITDLELANQAAVFQQAKLEWGKALAQVRADRERLNRFLGVWGENTQWKTADMLPALPEKEIPIDHLESLAIRQRLDLASAQRQVAVSAYALKLRSNTRYFPAGVKLGVDSERETDRQTVTGPTLALELPIFDHGQAAIPRLQAQYRQAQDRLDAVATDIRSEVRQAVGALITARDLTEFYEKVYLPQRIRIVNETLLQFDAMQQGPFELIIAKERELSAEREYIDAWRDYWIARAELEKTVGGRLGSETPAAHPASTATKQPEKQHDHHHE